MVNIKESTPKNVGISDEERKSIEQLHSSVDELCQDIQALHLRDAMLRIKNETSGHLPIYVIGPETKGLLALLPTMAAALSSSQATKNSRNVHGRTTYYIVAGARAIDLLVGFYLGGRLDHVIGDIKGTILEASKILLDKFLKKWGEATHLSSSFGNLTFI